MEVVKVVTHEIMRKLVKTEIAEKNIKQKLIAERCGYEQRVFSALINGHKSITPEDIIMFCTGMQIEPNTLFPEAAPTPAA